MTVQSEKTVSSAKTESSMCMTPNCSGVTKTRGLCQRCYAAASVQVKRGTVTWEKLTELGLAKPSGRENGSQALFNLALAAALRGVVEEKTTPLGQLRKRGPSVPLRNSKGGSKPK